MHIDAFNHALKRSRADGVELEPIIWVNTLLRGGMGGGGLCHLEREGLRYLVPVGHEGESQSSPRPIRSYGRANSSVNPLFAFSFLEAFLATLRDYLGETTETSIKDNFDIVYMVRLNRGLEKFRASRLTYSSSRKCWMRAIR